MTKLVILTAFHREWNYEALKKTVRDFGSRPDITINWTFVVTDLKKIPRDFPGFFVSCPPSVESAHPTGAFNKYNYALNCLEAKPWNDPWVMVLDDDCLLIPGGFFLLASHLLDPDAKVVFFAQRRGETVPSFLISDPRSADIGNVDMNQWVARRSAIGDIRFGKEAGADGLFVKALVERAGPENVRMVTEVLSDWNSLPRDPP